MIVLEGRDKRRQTDSQLTSTALTTYYILRQRLWQWQRQQQPNKSPSPSPSPSTDTTNTPASVAWTASEHSDNYSKSKRPPSRPLNSNWNHTFHRTWYPNRTWRSSRSVVWHPTALCFAVGTIRPRQAPPRVCLRSASRAGLRILDWELTGLYDNLDFFWKRYRSCNSYSQGIGIIQVIQAKYHLQRPRKPRSGVKDFWQTKRQVKN